MDIKRRSENMKSVTKLTDWIGLLPIESKFVSLNLKYQDIVTVAKLKTKKIAGHSCNLSSDGALKLTFLPFKLWILCVSPNYYTYIIIMIMTITVLY